MYIGDEQFIERLRRERAYLLSLSEFVYEKMTHCWLDNVEQRRARDAVALLRIAAVAILEGNMTDPATPDEGR